jgi:Undecaprenyl-phosphate galactose phosphotransferase WbaP
MTVHRPIRLWLPPFILAVGDLIALCLAYFVGYLTASGLSLLLLDRPLLVTSGDYLINRLVLSSLLVFFALYWILQRGHYSRRVPWWEQIRDIVFLCLIMLLVDGFINYTIKNPISRLWVVNTWINAIFILIAMRLLVRFVLKKLHFWNVSVILVGGPLNVLETLYALHSDFYASTRVRHIYLLGATSPIATQELPPGSKRAQQKIISPDDIHHVFDKASGDMLVFAPDDMSLDPGTVLAMAQRKDVDIAFVPPLNGIPLYDMRSQHFFGHDIVLLKPKTPLKGWADRFAKRTLDIVGALFGLIVLSIPLLFIAKKVRQDGGPFLYNQMRVGQHGKMFKCWKIRSMVVDSQRILQDLLASDPVARAEWEKDFKLKNDPRITKIGHFIRKTSIDELPQLWNVLCGDMSLVGPRPIVDAEKPYYGDTLNAYTSVRPGLTGLWQVSGRNDTSYAYRVYLDRWYVANWSFWTDIVIILKTVGILVNRKGAY